MYLIDSKAKRVPCWDSCDKFLNPYWENTTEVVNRAMIPESPANYPDR